VGPSYCHTNITPKGGAGFPPLRPLPAAVIVRMANRKNPRINEL
jgi:hypothetical protein